MGSVVILKPIGDIVVLLGEAQVESDRLLLEMLALHKAWEKQREIPEAEHDRLLRLQARLAEVHADAEHLVELLDIIERDRLLYWEKCPEGRPCQIVSEKGEPAKIIEMTVTRRAMRLTCERLRFLKKPTRAMGTA